MYMSTIESSSSSICNSDGDFDGPSQNLWKMLREACEDCQQQVAAFMTDNDGVQAPEEILTPTFIKSQLNEGVVQIDNKIESVWRLALDEPDDWRATRLVFEFLDMIIEEVDALHFLMLRLPLQCGEHFWLAYRERVEEEMSVVLGVERIYWSLRRGLGELPRRRDFSCAHRFKTLPLCALEDAQKRWESFCDTLRESCEELKSAVKSNRLHLTTSAAEESLSFLVGALDLEVNGEEVSFPVEEVVVGDEETTPGAHWFNLLAAEAVTLPSTAPSFVDFSAEELDFCKTAIPLIKLTHTVFKKVRLRYLGADCRIEPSRRKPAPRRIQLDDLLDVAERVPVLIEKVKVALLNPPHQHAIICQQLTQVVEGTEAVIEEVKEFLNDEEQAKWFDLAHRQLESFLQPLNQMNPFR